MEMVKLKDAEPLRFMRMCGTRYCYAIKLNDSYRINIRRGRDGLKSTARLQAISGWYEDNIMFQYQKSIPKQLTHGKVDPMVHYWGKFT